MPGGARGLARRKLIRLGLAGLGWLAGCRTRPFPGAREGPPDWEAWRARRLEEVAGPEGWTTVVGLHWIDQETTTLGTAPDSDLVLPPGSAPARVGVLRRQGGQVLFQPKVHAEGQIPARPPAVEPTSRILAHDDDGRGVAEVVQSGRLRWWILRRGERLAVRVKDPEARARQNFPGLPCFPWDPGWILEARLEVAEPGSTRPIRDLTGLTRQEPLAGWLVFSREGREHRLMALADRPAGDLFVLFRDRTSGRETYGPGRFLHVALPDASGRTRVDFNRAYNPPCAFTAYATCPRPPAENSLALRVTAGERSARGGEHST